MQDFMGHEAEYRGEDVLKKRGGIHIVLCGCGSLGSRLASMFACQGYKLITVIDDDKVERKNLSTQEYDPADIGRKKVTQTVNRVYRKFGVRATPIDKRLTATNVEKLLNKSDLVIDTFDNTESREIVRSVCEEMEIECVHAGMGSMGMCEVVWNSRYKVFDIEQPEDGPCEYPLATNLVVACVALAAETVNRFVDNGVQKDLEFWLKSMKLTESA